MAKRKKTLKRKLAADMRHQVYSLNDSSFVSPVPKKEKISNLPSGNSLVNSINVTSINITSYLRHDILKTTILTGTILLFQALLFLTLKGHIIRIPNISY